MKTIFLIPAVIACTIPLALRAEPPTNGSPKQKCPPPPGERPRRMGLGEKMRGSQSPEVQKRFEAAREKAMQDPKIQDLRKKADTAVEEFRNAMRDAMLKADPGLAEVLKDDWKHGKRGPENLSEGDRQKLAAAREKAKDSPAVQAAEAKKKDAKTPEERQAAMEEFHKAMREEILKADPSLGPILKQMHPPMPPPPHSTEAPGEE